MNAGYTRLDISDRSETLAYCVVCFDVVLVNGSFCIGTSFSPVPTNAKMGEWIYFFCYFATSHTLLACLLLLFSYFALLPFTIVSVSRSLPRSVSLCFVYTNRRRILKREYSFVLWNCLSVRFAFFFSSFNFFCYFYYCSSSQKNFAEMNIFLHKHRVISTPPFDFIGMAENCEQKQQ